MTLITGASRDPGEQGAAESDSLPIVRDSDGKLNHTWLARYLDVARDSDYSARERIDREQPLMVVVIDVHQVVELALGHAGLGTREPQVTRVIRKPSNRGREQSPIAPLERTDLDGAAVAELQSFRDSPIMASLSDLPVESTSRA